MYICIYVYMYICIYAYMYICICVYMYIRIYVYMNISSCPAGHLRHRAYCIPASMDSVVGPQLLLQALALARDLGQSCKREGPWSLFQLCPKCGPCAVCPCRPVSRSLFFSCESLAETKPTEPQKLQKKTSKIVQKSCKIDALGVILG